MWSNVIINQEKKMKRLLEVSSKTRNKADFYFLAK